MLINLEKLIKREIDILDLNFSQKIDIINYCGKTFELTSLVKIEGKIINTREGMYLDCEVQFSAVDNCSRCLEEIEVSINSSIKGFLVQDENIIFEDEDTFVYNGDELDFEDIIEDAFILNSSQKFLCSEECKGLCHNCGANLNEGQCKCHDDIDDEKFVDPRFSKLKDLLKND